MELMKRNPFQELEEMANRLNRLMNWPARRPANDQEAMTEMDWAPIVDISEKEKEYLIKVELPGVRKEQIKVMVQDGVLTIQGERKSELENKDEKYHRIERSYGKFMRRFTLPEEVEEQKVEAELSDGLLRVRLRKGDKSQPKAFQVKVA